VEWDGATSESFRVQIAVDSWDRPRLLEDVARTFAEHGANIVSYGGTVEDQMAKNWYVAQVGDLKSLRTLLTALSKRRRCLRRVSRDAQLGGADERRSPLFQCHSNGYTGVPQKGDTPKEAAHRVMPFPQTRDRVGGACEH